MKYLQRRGRRIRVLESVPPPGPTVQYIDEIVAYAPEEIHFSFFSYRAALFARYDVLHVHWPEWLIRHKSPLKSAVRRVLFRLWICRLIVNKTPVVRTVHNIEPHEAGSRSEAGLLSRLDRLTLTRVILNDCTPVNSPGTTVLIPHGDYREPFEHIASEQRVPGRVLLFGKIKPYKGVLELIRAAEHITDSSLHIRIVGAPTDLMRKKILDELAKPGRRGAPVSVELSMLSDEELVQEILRAELVLLPYQDPGNGNSGAAILALSMNRPILATRSCVMERLAEEVGAQWVQMMDVDLSAPEIESALIRARELPDGAVAPLKGRDWATVAASYAAVFQQAVGRADLYASASFGDYSSPSDDYSPPSD